MSKSRINLASRLLEVLDKDPKVLLDLLEAKHLAAHGGAPHRDLWVKKHHLRFPEKKAEKEKKTTKQAYLASAALASLIALINKRLLSNFFSAGQLLKRMKQADANQTAKLKARFNAEIAASKKSLADAYRKSYLYGLQSTGMPVRFGVTRNLSDTERFWLEGGLKQELKFFDGVVAEVKTGRDVATLLPRIKMYADALSSAYSAGQVVGTDKDTLIHWKLAPNASHCTDCIEVAKASPFTKDTLPTQPKSGWCQCKSNCKCTLSFELASKETVERIKKTSFPMAYWKSRLMGLKINSK